MHAHILATAAAGQARLRRVRPPCPWRHGPPPPISLPPSLYAYKHWSVSASFGVACMASSVPRFCFSPPPTGHLTVRQRSDMADLNLCRLTDGLKSEPSAFLPQSEDKPLAPFLPVVLKGYTVVLSSRFWPRSFRETGLNERAIFLGTHGSRFGEPM
jgi:putative hemolysin